MASRCVWYQREWVRMGMDCDILVLAVLAHNAMAPTCMPTDAPTTTTMDDNTTATTCP